MSFKMSDLTKAVRSNEKRLLRRLRELVEVESPSDSKVAVNRAADVVVGWAGELGGKVKRHRQRAFGDVLELRFGPAASKRGRILLLGHIDTVWPIGTLARMPWREADGKLWGPGILDMKAGVVMALEAIAALRKVDTSLVLDRPVTFLLNSEEELGSPVSRLLTERLAAKCSAVFVLEPAQGLAYKTARKGVGQFNLRVTGVAAHAGVDFERGHSAVLEMAKLVERVSKFTDISSGLTVSVGVMSGGTRSNVIPAECTAEVDVRIRRRIDAERIEKMFRRLRTFDKACKLTVSGGMNRPPMERKPGTVRLFRQAKALASEMGILLEEAATGGGSDGNFTAALGLATLDGMGAVGAGAHASNEHVVIKHLVERTTLLAAMIASAS